MVLRVLFSTGQRGGQARGGPAMSLSDGALQSTLYTAFHILVYPSVYEGPLRCGTL